MRSFILTIILFNLFVFQSAQGFAQLSDLHYLPPLKQKNDAFIDQLIYLSTPETTAFNVNVYQGTNTTAVATISVSKAAGGTYNPGVGNNDVTLLTAANTGSVQSNSGLRFESTSGKKFYVNWRGKSTNQASSLTSKGRAALGTAFKWVGVPNRGTLIAQLTNSLGIMATEDNTVVNVFGYNPNCTFRNSAGEFGNTSNAITISLNKGQTYVLEAAINSASSANIDGWIGASITSNKAIAVSFGQMHFQAGVFNNQDCGIDQIIPENKLGKEYIFVRANGIDATELPVIIATQNDTKIYVNGASSPIATINNGDYFTIPATNFSQSSTTASVPGANMYVRTSKEAYAVQAVAGNSNTATGDINFIAPVNCLLSNTVDNIPDVSNIAGATLTGGVTIVASAATPDADIVIKYGSSTVSTSHLISTKRTVAGTSEWKTYYLSGLTGNVSVTSTGPIAVGYLGAAGNAGVSGYFSGFETIPTIEVERVGNGCLPSTVLTATAGFTSYTWYRDGVVIPGVITNSYTPDMAGKFTVTVSNGTCSFASANQYIYDCSPEIIVNTTADKNGILAGESVTFQVSVLYLSDFNVDNLVLTNLVPANLTVTATSATYGTISNVGSTYTWSIGTMRNGEEHLLTITATGNAVAVATPVTLNVTKTQTTVAPEINKVPDDFSETVTIYSALTTEPVSHPTGWYFTNTGSAHPYNNVLHFTASQDAEGYLVVRQAGSQPTFVPADGSSYSIGLVSGGEIIYQGNLTAVTDFSAAQATDYHYIIYPYKGGGSATNYLTTNPLIAVINNPIANSLQMATSTKSSSAGLANKSVNVTFVNGVVSGGATITAEKYTAAIPANHTQGLPVGITTVKNLYYTVTSSVPNPGDYIIVLDFSSLNMTETEWNNARILKRSNSSANWQEITSNVISRAADGLMGKLVISDLNSFSDYAVGSSATLPVSLVSFSAKRIGALVSLEWKTASEQHSKDFIIEHSINSIQWSTAGSVSAAGNSNVSVDYKFVHTKPVSGNNYYRLLKRDLDGNSSISGVKMVSFNADPDGLTVIGNPVRNGLLKFHINQAGTVKLTNIEGRVMASENYISGNHLITVQHLLPGIYLLGYKSQVIKILVK